MPTWQTSTSNDRVSERAVDGNTGGGVWRTDTCTCTSNIMYGVLYPTWGLQLRGDEFEVHYVTITNRLRYCKLLQPITTIFNYTQTIYVTMSTKTKSS